MTCPPAYAVPCGVQSRCASAASARDGSSRRLPGLCSTATAARSCRRTRGKGEDNSRSCRSSPSWARPPATATGTWSAKEHLGARARHELRVREICAPSRRVLPPDPARRRRSTVDWCSWFPSLSRSRSLGRGRSARLLAGAATGRRRGLPQSPTRVARCGRRLDQPHRHGRGHRARVPYTGAVPYAYVPPKPASRAGPSCHTAAIVPGAARSLSAAGRARAHAGDLRVDCYTSARPDRRPPRRQPPAATSGDAAFDVQLWR